MSRQISFSTRSARAAVIACASIAGPLVSSVQSALVIDVRAVSASGGAIVQNSKNVIVSVASPGAVINFEVHALISASNNGSTTDEGLLLLAGSFLSTDHVSPGGAARGPLLASRASNFNGASSTNGLQQDLDGDGDLDVGSNNAGSALNYFTARSSASPDPVFGQDVLVGTMSFTITQFIGFLPGSTTDVNFRYRNLTISAASWFENGIQSFPTGGNATVGAPVAMTVIPEPGTVGGMAVAALGTLARRRRSR